MMKASSLALVGVGAACVIGALLFACGTDNNVAGGDDGGSSEAGLTDGTMPGMDGATGGDTSLGDSGADGSDSSTPMSCGDGGAGMLDRTFGDGGLTILPYPASGGYSVALQPDGKILVGGYSASKLLLARLLANGAPDTSFGANGVVLIPFGDFGAVVQSLVLQADGRIVGAGSAHIPGRPGGDQADFGVYRWYQDGGIDTTFGDGGIASTNLGATDNAYGVAVLPSGHIVVGGSTTSSPPKFAVVRYNSDGSIDPTFGVSGIVTTDLGGAGSAAHAMIVLPDGRITLAGLNAPSGTGVFAAARYQASGALDPTFADAGVLVTGQPTSANGLILNPGGNATLAGHNGADFVLVQITPNGSIAGAFGTGGLVTTDFGATEDVLTLARQADGKLVAAGTQVVGGDPNFRVALARYLVDGRLDPSFGTGGKSTTSFGPTYSATPNALAISGCGVVVVAVMPELSAGDSVVGIVRYGL
jgi:uncharacterized delta-60 repeat protein